MVQCNAPGSSSGALCRVWLGAALAGNGGVWNAPQSAQALRREIDVECEAGGRVGEIRAIHMKRLAGPEMCVHERLHHQRGRTCGRTLDLHTHTSTGSVFGDYPALMLIVGYN